MYWIRAKSPTDRTNIRSTPSVSIPPIGQLDNEGILSPSYVTVSQEWGKFELGGKEVYASVRHILVEYIPDDNRVKWLLFSSFTLRATQTEMHDISALIQWISALPSNNTLIKEHLEVLASAYRQAEIDPSEDVLIAMEEKGII